VTLQVEPGQTEAVLEGGSGAIDRRRRAGDPRALIMDAMGELRPIYEPSLVREMLASGMDSITVTLCDPKPEQPPDADTRLR
jgi:membrane dipeptidase